MIIGGFTVSGVVVRSSGAECCEQCGASQGKAAGRGRGGTIIIPSHQQPLKMPQVFVTRRETLSAAHRLHCVHLSDEENRELYGPCNNIHGHGHNYVIEVR